MGLDVYLRQYKDFAGSKIRELEYESRSNKVWKDVYGVAHDDNDGYEALKQRIGQKGADELYKKYKSLCKPIADELKLDDYGDDEDGYEDISEKSKLYPDHELYSMGYFRSSYNESGINHVVREAIGKDLDYIFSPGEEYEFKPYWEQSLTRANETLAEFKDYLENVGPYRVTQSAWNEFMGHPDQWSVKSKEDAMGIFKEQLARSKNPDNHASRSYSNSQGDFYFDYPLQVVATITGVQKRFFVGEHIPCTYLVYKVDDKDGGLDFYVQCLEIVIETIKWVLAQPNKDQFYLAWSA